MLRDTSQLPAVVVEDEAAMLDVMARERDRLKSQIDRLRNQLHSHLFKVDPQYRKTFPSLSKLETVQRLEHYTRMSRCTGNPDAARAVDLLEQVPSGRLVPVDAQLARLAAELAGEYRLRSGDALYVALAQRPGVSLVTWDLEQTERGGGAMPVFTPQEAPIE